MPNCEKGVGYLSNDRQFIVFSILITVYACPKHELVWRCIRNDALLEVPHSIARAQGYLGEGLELLTYRTHIGNQTNRLLQVRQGELDLRNVKEMRGYCRFNMGGGLGGRLKGSTAASRLPLR